MRTIKDLLIWGDVNEFEWDRVDFKYGNKLFTDEKIDNDRI